jgi:glycerate 2-kinase
LRGTISHHFLIMGTPVADATTIFLDGVAAVHPGELMHKNVQVVPGGLRIAGTYYPLSPLAKVCVIGAGKAVAAMAQALENILSSLPLYGLVITKYGHALPLQHIQILEAAHPVPDMEGVVATQELLNIVAARAPHDLVIFLLSGGASALLADYPEGSSLQEVQQLFTLLLNSGADIHEMNTVRKHMSRIKGGQLAKKIAPATLCTLILSDVPGNDPQVIGSAPTVPDPSTFGDTIAILKHYGISHQLAPALLTHLQEGLAGTIPDTPKPGDPHFDNAHHYLTGTNTLALEAAAHTARRLGYHTQILTDMASGDAATLGQQLVQQAIQWQGPTPACLLVGGETTVKVTGTGLGGRNQQLALAAGLLLQQHPHITLLSGGTDGTDGPTDAAGAVVNAAIMQQATALHLNPLSHLQNNNAYPFFEAAGGLLKAGPTQTNVMDIVIVLIV